MALLDVENLSIEFGGLKAVENFNLSLEKGELIAIIGPNGAGKTTIFNMLTGIYVPTSGSIKLEGHSLLGLRPYQFAQAGIARTFQNIRLFSGASVIDNVKMAYTAQLKENFFSSILRTPGMVEKERDLDARALSLLSLFGLENQADIISKNLPYGVQRRLEIVRALMLNPKILLLDEPVAGMVTTELDEMAHLVRELRDKHGQTIILIEHHMNFVMPIADRIIVLNFGKTISEGVAEEIQKDPRVIEAYLGRGLHVHA